MQFQPKKKNISVTLLKVPVSNTHAFMRTFIGNLGVKHFVYQQLTGYINKADRVGVLGNYEDPLICPMDASSELVATEFLKAAAKDETFKGFVWVIENRGAFSSSFLAFLHTVANVNRKPKQFDPMAN